MAQWQIFYEIIGTAGATLIGIQFIVITLIASIRRRSDVATINAFGTPTVVNFGGALALAAIMTAPWSSALAVSVVLVLCGLAGLAYAAIVFRRARRQTEYKPVMEDWAWYVIAPAAIYAALTLAGLLLTTIWPMSLFIVGVAALGLLLVGIRNAWDSVTHIVSTADQGDAAKPK